MMTSLDDDDAEYVGTPDYGSTRALKGYRQGPRDDLESLAYTLLEMWGKYYGGVSALCLAWPASYAFHFLIADNDLPWDVSSKVNFFDMDKTGKCAAADKREGQYQRLVQEGRIPR